VTLPALTTLSEDERLFRDSVYEFANREIRPLSRDMDERSRIPPSLIEKLFALGVMGIEIPEEHGGSGASFFHSVLAVEALSRVDPAIAVLVDVQNTLVINALQCWGSTELRTAYLPRLASTVVGAYAMSEAGSGSDAFALSSPGASSGSRTRSRRASSSCLPPWIPPPATAASRRSSSNGRPQG
jgi:alkylation response protein AidB-like acyl-CoA dehydrogenase